MNREDFGRVMAVLSAGVGKPAAKETTRVYYELLSDLPLPALQLAAKRALLESEYPVLPPVGTLRKLALEAMQAQRPLPAEAWEMCRRAIARWGYCREQQGLASLPDDVRRAAEVLGWQSLCESTEPEVCRAQFQKAYESLAERRRRTEALPAPMREAIGHLVRQFTLPALADNREAS